MLPNSVEQAPVGPRCYQYAYFSAFETAYGTLDDAEQFGWRQTLTRFYGTDSGRNLLAKSQAFGYSAQKSMRRRHGLAPRPFGSRRTGGLLTCHLEFAILSAGVVCHRQRPKLQRDISYALIQVRPSRAAQRSDGVKNAALLLL
jgi:hypothetical protein